jgi:hypothetical protein
MNFCFKSPTGQVKRGRIGPQRVDIVAVLIAGRDHKHPRHRHLGVAVADTGWIAPVIEGPRDRPGPSEPGRDLTQHDQAAVRRQATGIERGCEWLAFNR